MGQADIQIGKAALGFPPDAAPGIAGIGFELFVPILAFFAVHQHGIQHAHARHEHRAVRDLSFVQVEIVTAQLIVMAVAGVHPCVAHEQVFDALGLAALFEQLQRRDNLVVHLIVKRGVVLEVLKPLPAINL